MKNSLVIYYDILEQLKDFSDEQFGCLLRAVINYDRTGELPTLTNELSFAFKFMKPVLDKNKEKYEELCEKRRVSGAKGGKQKVANATKCYQEQQELASVADNVNVNDNVNVIEVSKKESNKNILLSNTCAHVRESYDEIFQNLEVAPEVKNSLIEFIRHCQVNGHIVTNSKLKQIIFRLDQAYSNDEQSKIASLKRAINGGYYDIQEGRV